MKEKIIEIIRNSNDSYWDNDSETESPEVTPLEQIAIDKSYNSAASDIIELVNEFLK